MREMVEKKQKGGDVGHVFGVLGGVVVLSQLLSVHRERAEPTL